MRQGKRGSDAVSSICVTTQKKLCKQYNVIRRKPQILTDARFYARDCRLSGVALNSTLLTIFSLEVTTSKNARRTIIRRVWRSVGCI
jgi:hypothetical protein